MNAWKYYDGFILQNRETKDEFRYPYVKGIDNRDSENKAIKELVGLTGYKRSNFWVLGFVPKGKWNDR